MTLSKREYESLLTECSSQETLIAGFQKENEKLLIGYTTREKENTLSKARFFDQQEMLNKELNKLRNIVGEVPKGVERVVRERETESGPQTQIQFQTSDAIGSENTQKRNINPSQLPSSTATTTTMPPHPPSNTHYRKSAEVLREELDRDSFIQHLRERAAIAESGAGVRERELQLVSCTALLLHNLELVFQPPSLSQS